MINKCIDKIKNKFKFQKCYRAYSKAIGAVGLFSFINMYMTRKAFNIINEKFVYYTKHEQALIL